MALVAMCKGFEVTAIGCFKVACYDGRGVSAISLILSAARKGSLRSPCMWLLFARVLRLLQVVASLVTICKGFK